MKKLTLLSTIATGLLLVGLLVSQAMARGGDGTGPGTGRGQGMGRGDTGCPYYGGASSNPETQKFLDATLDLRKSLIADQAELNAVMAAQNPDPKKARELAQKITDSQLSIQAKAREMKIQTAGCSGSGMGGNAGGCPRYAAGGNAGCSGNGAADCPRSGAKTGASKGGQGKPCCQQ